MGRSSKSRYIAIASGSQASTTIHNSRPIRHSTTEEDLLGDPDTFVELSDLAPGECSALHVAIIQAATCVGPTALVLPYVFLLGGFLLTLILLPIFAFVACALRLRLVQLGISHGVYSLHGLATIAFGHKGAIVSGLLQVTVSGGLIATYFVILFQDLPILLTQALDLNDNLHSSTTYPSVIWLLRDRVRFAELLTAGAVVPFCLGWSSHTELKRSCMMVALALFVAWFFVLVNAPTLHKRDVPLSSSGFSNDYLTMHIAVCHSMAILATAFASPHHTFHSFYALQQRSIGRFAWLSIGSTLISIFWALGFGVGGYLSFLSDTKADVLQNYINTGDGIPSNHSWMYWIVIPFCAIPCIALEIVVSQHTYQFFSRAKYSFNAGTDDILFWSQPAPSRLEPGTRRESNKTRSGFNWKSKLATATAVIAIAQAAIFTRYSIATAMSVTGTISGLALLFILPAACHLKLTVGDDDDDRGGWLLMRLFPTLSIATGLVGIISCAIVAAV
ncbi:Amino acid transporter [Phytophthora palmivora]|uniref:Amino acid transporter n=1 Tax=Phytophthora palmivora TaxID=4796 RepID=A0A2P4YL50_9STRA|nr:Amino acid transporter [Phytophthora palmivora]